MQPPPSTGDLVCHHSAVDMLLTQEGSPPPQAKSRTFTKRQWLTLIAIGSFHFSSAICISLQAPFYPQEAESKGATATEYGLVFGSFELVAFLSSPIIGRYLYTMGVKITLNCGIVIASVSAICFGLLDMVPTHDMFISLSFLLRMTESLGSTAALVAAFSITAAVFPQSVATTFAALEVFYGLGYIAGPTLGGLLFSIGGYQLPFIVMGTIMSVVGLFIFIVLPPLAKNEALDDSKASMRKILKVPGVVLDSLGVISISISIGFYAATLEPHIREFGLSPVANGLIFIISGGTYALVAPLVGRICDKWVYPKKVMCCGSLLVIASYILVGPLPFLPLPTTLPLCIVGLAIHGFGIAGLMVPTFIDSICSAVSAGFQDDINTYGLISGLWSSSFALGAFIGPSIAGVLYDSVGFRYGTLFVIAEHAILFVIMVLFVSFEKRRGVPPLPRKRIRVLSGCGESSCTNTMDEEEETACLTRPKTKKSSRPLDPCWIPPESSRGNTSAKHTHNYGAILPYDDTV